MSDDKQEVRKDIITEFGDLPWHDSQLLNVHVVSLPGRKSTVSVDVKLRGTQMVLQLTGSRGILMDFDLLGKAYCSHHIATAYSERVSDCKDDFVNGLSEVNEGLLYVFTVELISPGGKLRVVAEDFQIKSARDLDC